MTSRSPPAWRVRMTRPAVPGVVRYHTEGPVSPQLEKGSVRRSTVASCVVPFTVAGSGSSDCAAARLSLAGAAAKALAGANASAATIRASRRRDTATPWTGGTTVGTYALAESPAFRPYDAPVPSWRIMGVLNVTPDSFSDGGEWFDRDAAIARGHDLVAQGADLVDLGGESTRPGARPVDSAEELRRVVPVVEALAG